MRVTSPDEQEAHLLDRFRARRSQDICGARGFDLLVRRERAGPALAQDTRPVAGAALRDDVAADPGKKGDPLLRIVFARFPTPRALADAPLADAIRVWGDLGRYKRVVNLRRTARILVKEFGGEVPSNPGELVKLPGIGPYTAGAVACFAFDKDTAFVDTNARRVLHRLFFRAEVPEPFATERELLRLAEALVPRGRGWKWGQSIIEFGAIQCTARKPLCESCPLSDLCAAKPVIWAALTSLPRAENAAYRYEGSNRYYRGR